MGFEDILKAYTPQENDDEVKYPALKGRYKTKINHIKVSYAKNDTAQTDPSYELELETTEDLEGQGTGIGKRLWKRYKQSDDAKAKAFINDMFTAGITLAKSKEDMEADFPMLRDHNVYVRAWGFASKTKKDGSSYAPGEKPDMVQTFVIYNPASVKAKPAAASKVPF